MVSRVSISGPGIPGLPEQRAKTFFKFLVGHYDFTFRFFKLVNLVVNGCESLFVAGAEKRPLSPRQSATRRSSSIKSTAGFFGPAGPFFVRSVIVELPAP